MLARLLRSVELQFAGPFLLQRHTLDNQAGIVGRPPNQQPPVLLLAPRIPTHRQTTGWVMHACVGDTSQTSSDRQTTGRAMHASVDDTSRTSSDVCPPCKARSEPPTLLAQPIRLSHVSVHASIAKPSKADSQSIKQSMRCTASCRLSHSSRSK